MFAFLIPVAYEGKITIPVSVANDILRGWVTAWLPSLVMIILAVSAVATAVFVMGPSRLSERWPDLGRLFNVGRAWLILRGLALVLGAMIFAEVGPQFIWGDTTGQVVFDLTMTVVTLFLIATFLLPLLTEYGLMEIVGAGLSPLFRRCFTLPGRSAVDASASWFSSGAVGVLITSQQYLEGYYSAREASVIATNFSVVSLPFCLVIATLVGLGDRFFEYYAVVIVAGVICAVVLPRIPPLVRIPDTWANGHSPRVAAVGRSFAGELAEGFRAGLDRARTAPGPAGYARHALLNLLDIWFGLIPGVIVVGLFGLILAEYTPIDEWLTLPLVPILELMRIPEAAAVAPTLVVGFADQFLPAAMGQALESELARFVVAGISVSQLIYMSEVGILILKSPIPLRFPHLVWIFLLRTAITLPVFVGAGHLLGFAP